MRVEVLAEGEREKVAAHNGEETDEAPVLAEVGYKRETRQRSLHRIGPTVQT